MNITKEQATIMRGWAIMFISLHNFFHLEAFGLPQENETVFNLERTADFFQQLFSGTPHVIGVLLSFIGWCGVPVFVLLSGYGLSKKYKKDGGKIDKLFFVKHCYIKLLCLIFPAAIFFLTFHSIEGAWKTVLKGIFSLTFFNTFIPGFSSLAPPFWYFSLTFQLYLAYLLFHNIENRKSLLAIVLAFLTLYIFVGPDFLQSEVLLKRMRLTLFGWIPVFVIGLLIASNDKSIIKKQIFPTCGLEKNDINRILLIVLVLLSFALLLLMNINYYLWVLMPLIAIVFFYGVALLVENITVINILSLWIGKNSSYIFVSHPIALLVIENAFGNSLMELSLTSLAIIYTILFLVISMIYKIIHLRIVKIVNLK